MSTTVDTARLEITTNADQYAADVKKIEGATKGMGANLGRSALEASRAIEDLQYGIGGVVNNIPGLVSALGGGAGAPSQSRGPWRAQKRARRGEVFPRKAREDAVAGKRCCGWVWGGLRLGWGECYEGTLYGGKRFEGSLHNAWGGGVLWG